MKMKKANNKLLIPIMALTMLLSASTIAQNTYFRHVFIDGTNAIIGKYPVRDSIAKKINCYHFVNDITGRLIKVEYIQCGKLSKGNDLGFVSQIIIEYSRKKEKRFFLNIYGINTSNNKGYDSIIFTLNDSNYRSSAIYYHSNKVWDDFEIEYFATDNYGRITKTITKSKGDVIRRITTNKYDESGNLIEVRFFNSDKKLIEDRYGVAIYRYQFDSYKNKIEEKHYGKNEKLKENDDSVAIVQYKYDDNGNLIEVRDLDTAYKIKTHTWKTTIKSYKYDDMGNVIEEKWFNAEEKLRENGTAIIRYKYDDIGNQIEESNYSADEKLIQDYAIYKYKYDDMRGTIQISRFGPDGKLLPTSYDHCAVIKRYKYDNRGNLIEESFYDEKENLVANPGGIAIYRYIYDDNGNLIEEKHFNSKNDEFNTNRR
jgi:YD repeat-containing protein